MKGKLIVLEGTDGTGKTTQVRLMAQRLEREGVSFPGTAVPSPRRWSGICRGIWGKGPGT